ncbi:RHS repeat-associated core domain-containing protein, partial [Pseudomonas agarici]
NKLLTYQDKRYRYDGFGRMIEKRSASHRVQRFAYDAEHRLIEVHNQDGVRETVVRMTYDPLGRRIGKTEHNHNGYLLGETRFTWDGLRLLQEHKNTQTSLYLYVDEGYEPLARVDGLGDVQKIRYYHTDPNGLPEQLTEADGTRVWQARYKVWGNTLEEVREPYYIEEQNLRFQGQYLDRETGLHYNTFRFYDPDVGRFTTPDPIGLAGGVNLYQYAPNTAGWIDPLGWASSNPGVYSVYFEAYLPSPEMYKLNDPTHFSEANRQLHYEVKNNPTLASQLENKYPGILNHVNPTSKGTFRGTAPRNTSWHHHGQVGGLLQLVDKKDHSSRHKDYHPKKSRRHYVGGRNVWGGGGRCR